ncbi:MAG TPA: PQQ-dependent dehydrogenase, methanol/ethanol family [Terriglobia bacterium]|nr:PQQ-dependent dehydrogenase, methanol/ethanol family [Terriglobia bacterium]
MSGRLVYWRLAAACAGTLFLIAGCNRFDAVTDSSTQEFANVDDDRLARAEQDPQNWLIYNGSWREQRYSALDQINAGNVSQLKPAWVFEFDTTRGQESTPLVVDGVMYVTTAWSKVYALDAKTGAQRWRYDPRVPGAAGVNACCDVDNRGAAVYKGKVFLATIDGRLIALDASSGAEVWSVQTTPQNSTYYSTGAPRVARDKVFIGNSGADLGGRGYVSAYDVATGALVWRFYTVPGDPNATPDGAVSDDVLKNVATPTWSGEWYRLGGGGHVWNSLVYDPDFNQLYLATGNGFPWNPNLRSAGKGDNLFIASIVAVDADTGRYKWHYQESPGEGWDHDAISDMVLTDLNVDGQTRKALVHPPKNGFMYVIDRETGKLLAADPFVSGVTWAKGVDLVTGKPEISPSARYTDKPALVGPGGGGAHNWHPIAFSPKTGLLYLQVTDNSSSLLIPTRLDEFKYILDRPSLGIDFAAMITGGAHTSDPSGRKVSPAPNSAPPKPYLLAWDPVARQPVWKVEARGGGVLATAGNLVFHGETREGVMGKFVAHRADTGETLWSLDTPNAINAGAVAYSVDGEQYIAVTSGATSLSGGGPTRVRQPGRLLAFKLQGTATLPADPALDIAPLFVPPASAPEDIAKGEAHYYEFCARCHGPGAAGSNVITDLRRSTLIFSPDAWQSVVSDGALESDGMMGWSRYLSRDEIDTIRLFVVEQARPLGKPEPSPTGPETKAGVRR